MIPAVYEFVAIFTPLSDDTSLESLEKKLFPFLSYVNLKTRRAGTFAISPLTNGMYCLRATRQEHFDDFNLFKASQILGNNSEELFFVWDNNQEVNPGYFHIISLRTDIMHGGRNVMRENLQSTIDEAASRAGMKTLESESGYCNRIMTVVLRSEKPITQKQTKAVIDGIETVKDCRGKPCPVILGYNPPHKMTLFERLSDWLRWKLRGY